MTVFAPPCTLSFRSYSNKNNDSLITDYATAKMSSPVRASIVRRREHRLRARRIENHEPEI